MSRLTPMVLALSAAGLAVAALGWCARSRDPAPPAPSSAVRVQVEGVLDFPDRGLHAVLLSPGEGDLVLPVFVEEAAARVISARLARRAPPAGGDLLERSIRALGGRVERVVLDGPDPRSVQGLLTLDRGRDSIDLSAAAADSIGLALSAQAPLLVERRLLAESGLAREQVGALLGENCGRLGTAPPRDFDLRL